MDPPSRPNRTIARQLVLGFGSVSLVSIGMCILLLFGMQDVSAIVVDMRKQESSGIDSLVLATAVREQSLHIAHSVIEGDTSRLDQYQDWREKVRSRVQRLGPAIPDAERARLAELGDKTQRIHDTFTTVLVPLLESGELDAARRHHRELFLLGEQAATEADALALAVRARMHDSHRVATSTVRTARLLGGVCATIVLLLAAWFTLRLRKTALWPLYRLTESVRRFGRGDLRARVGDLGESEVGELARVFDHMADELSAREKKLVRQERMAAIGQLAAGVAHELNNPIGIIRGYLKIMEPDGDRETLRKELGILDEEASHCQRIAEDLLSYSRASDLELEEVETGSFLKSTVARFVEQTPEPKPDVKVDVQDRHIRMDRGRMRQVLMNLLKNAVEAADGEIRVCVRGEVVGEDVYRIDVEDSGIGIPSELSAQVFEPFFSRRKGGTGLGLAVVAGIVRGHGGTVEALGSPTGGTIVRLEIPIPGPPTSLNAPAPEPSK